MKIPKFRASRLTPHVSCTCRAEVRRRRVTFHTLPILGALLFASPLSVRAQEDIHIDWWTVDAGGGTSGDAEFSVSGTIGQPDAGTLTDGIFTVEGGFWSGGLVAAPGQTNRTWIGPVNGDWFNANNWSPAGVPGPYDAILFKSGTINLSSPVTINGQFNWSGGTLVGSALSIGSGGALNLSGNGTLSLASALTNAGTVNWLGGYVILNSGSYPNAGPVVNQAGGQWNIQCDGYYLDSYAHAGANAYFVNEGTVRKTAGGGSTYIWVPFCNSGLVNVAQGTLTFYNGGPIGGSFSAASGAGIAFSGGDFTGAGAVVSGPGAVQFSGGNLQLSTNLIPNLALTGGTVSLGRGFQGGSITNLTLAGSTLSGTNVVTGTFNWSGGALSGPMRVAGGGVLNLSGNGTLYLASALTNGGTVNWLGGYVILNSGSYPNAGPVVNQAGGQWNIQCDGYYLDSYAHAGANAYFVNEGTVHKTAGGGSTYIWVPFYNLGLVSVAQGTLTFYNGGSIGGSFSAASGAGIAFSGGDFTGAGAVVSGPGVVQFNGGNLLLSTNLIPNLALTGGTVSLGRGFQGGSITNLTLAGSTLSGTNVVTGTFNWSGGALSGPMTTAGGGVLNLNGNGTLSLASALTNAGTVNWLGGYVILNSGSYPNAGPVVNQAGGQWNIQCDGYYLDSYAHAGANAYFVNEGTVRKTAGGGSTYIWVPFYNPGLVSVAQGTLTFYNGGPIGGSLNTSSSGAGITFSGGDFTGAGAAVNGPGVVQFNGGNLLLSTNLIPNLALTGGTVSLGRGFQGGSITNLALAGSTLSGTNVVTGTFNWSGGALSGPMRVAGGGVLNLSGNGTLYLASALTNGGTVNWLGGYVILNSGSYPNAGPVVNQAGGQWTIQCDGYYLDSYAHAGANAYFVNEGTVCKTAGGGCTYIWLPFYNRGSLSVLSGSVSFNLVNGYTQSGATLNFGLAGVGRPTPLQVGGTLNLDGTLSASVLNDYAPRAGDVLPLISCGALANSFSYLDLPPAGNNLAWRVVYAPSGVSLQVISNGAFTARISGTVTETGGAPVPNLLVFAYTTNSDSALFLSATTASNGAYALYVTNSVWRVGLQGLAARGYAEAPTQDVVVDGANQVANFVVQGLTGLVLGCERIGDGLMLYWPATETNCVLEAATTLRPGSWASAPEKPMLQGARWTAMVELAGDSRFFRIKKGASGQSR